MKFRASLFAAPAALASTLFLANCSGGEATDTSGTAGNPANPGAGGSSPGTGGKGGSASSSAGAPGAAGIGTAGLSSGGTPGSVAGASGADGGGVVGAGTAGVPSGAAGGTAVEASFATVKAVIAASCFGNGCHSQEGNPLQMKIDDKLYGTLTAHVTAHCGKLLNTTSPADSGLIRVMQGDCGTTPEITYRMPWDKCFQGETDNEFCVAPAKIAAIQAWIAKGAPPQ